jgi:hypothetical protein
VWRATDRRLGGALDDCADVPEGPPQDAQSAPGENAAEVPVAGACLRDQLKAVADPTATELPIRVSGDRTERQQMSVARRPIGNSRA